MSRFDRDPIFLRNIRNLDEEAWELAYREFFPDAKGMLMRMGSDPLEAEQIAADAVHKIVEECNAGRGPRNSFWGMFRKTAYNEKIDQVRDSRRLAGFDVSDAISRQDYRTFEREAERKMQLDKVLSVAGRVLSDDQKQVIFCRFVAGMDMNETASAMGKKLDDIRNLQHRGIAKLKKQLKDWI